MTDFPIRLRWLSGALLVSALAVAVALGASEPRPDLVALCLFGALVVFSEHRAVVFRSGVTFSPAFMVSMAAVVVFVGSGSRLGPLLVGMATGLHISTLRRGRRGWIAFNAGNIGLATCAAAFAYDALPVAITDDMPLALLSAAPPALAVTVVSWSVVAASYRAEGTPRPARELLGDLIPAVGQTLPFAVLGLLLGRMYLDLGASMMLLIVVPILIAREMFASYLQVKEAHEDTVQMLVRALEAKDRYTAGHAERVAKYAHYIGEELGFTPGRLERLRFGALMHDIGKLAIPNHLLNKPGKLTAEEFARVRVHEQVSMEMLGHIDFLRPIAMSSHSEFTRFRADDPNHPIEPYIVLIADAYDAMTSTRAYRKALSQHVAFAELREKSGTQFHPDCVEALVRALERRNERHGAGVDGEVEEYPEAPLAGLGSAGLGDLLSNDAPGLV